MSAITGTLSRRELTIRGIVIGIIITVVFTAANVYAGLKAGLTFSTSIPAAVISMAILKALRDATIQENNIVQTVASAAGTLSSIIFVLPGLIMIGWWTGFPFWTSFGICVTGGILGVMYTIPLRRALVTDSDLPYPEGVACAEVLKVGASGSEEKLAHVPVETEAHGAAPSSATPGSGAGLRAVVTGAILSAIFYVVVQTRIFASDVASYFRIGDRGSASGFDFSLSFMLFGVGHLVGLWVGVAMGVGALIGWAWAVPHFTALHPATGAAADVAQGAWSHYVRFVGAGTIGVAAIYTLGKLVKPVVAGLAGALRASRARSAGTLVSMPRTEHDMPIGMVGLISLACLIPVGFLLWNFSRTSGLGDHVWLLTIGGVLFVVILSFVVSAVCGYMAGLIGSSNSPLSGIGILVVIIAALLLVAGVQAEAGTGKAVVAFALFITAIVFAVASIANNNLQDLKTGQLVDATPEKQQWALVIGVIAGALVIPPVLNLMQQAFGFNGAPGADPARALPAPQAGLISALAQGVITHNIDWSLIGIGAVIGVIIIVLDEILARTAKGPRLPPLAVGLGIYLPTSTTLMVVVGAVVGAFFDARADRGRNPEGTKQLGVLLASGLIVGESLLAVLYALLIAFADQLGFSNPHAPLALVGDSFAMPALVIGGLVFAAIVAATYIWAARRGQTAA
ncbi:MAG: oligopeptide transporter [Rhodanobacteraceae bacterium]|jgi:putative OPT family oligopeptide transporter|nr:MAG: oligopeptide transporter [Rhodanobacteraceae bacterium]